ncbi:Uncharacterised protein [Vibrio cholerae]|nr:Uncharacterised protein [Vibrio cholerae]CSD50554.1 Uncharacterised protein [Vibrio cholerae]
MMMVCGTPISSISENMTPGRSLRSSNSTSMPAAVNSAYNFSAAC